METTESYAAGKRDLRETAKWLANTVAGLTAVVIGGTPFSGLGSLRLWSVRFYAALFSLGVASMLLMLVWHRLLHLLRPDMVFPSQLQIGYNVNEIRDQTDKSEIKKLRVDLELIKSDFFPNLATYDKFLEDRKEAWDAIRDNDPTTKETFERYDARVTLFLKYATFARLHNRLTASIPRITLLTAGALVFLLIYAWAANPGSDARSDRLVVLQNLPQTPISTAPSIEPVLFELGKYGLDEKALVTITKARDFLKEHPDTGVLLLTYTDTLGDSETNSRLARHRGIAVRDALMLPGGVPPNRIFISDLPETALPKITHQQVAEPENRSVEFLFVQLHK